MPVPRRSRDEPRTGGESQPEQRGSEHHGLVAETIHQQTPGAQRREQAQRLHGREHGEITERKRNALEHEHAVEGLARVEEEAEQTGEQQETCEVFVPENRRERVERRALRLHFHHARRKFHACEKEQPDEPRAGGDAEDDAESPNGVAETLGDFARAQHGEQRPEAEHHVACAEVASADVERHEFRNRRRPGHAAHGVAEVRDENNGGKNGVLLRPKPREGEREHPRECIDEEGHEHDVLQ